MVPFYFVTGGCRSGKSALAHRLAESLGTHRVYIATAKARDDEMERRIARHKNTRGPSWATVELPPGFFSTHITDNPNFLLKRIMQQGQKTVLLFDCLTLWLLGEMEKGLTEESLVTYMDRLFAWLLGQNIPTVMVSNEIGLGGIASTALGRAFADIAGLANQIAARRADGVLLSVSGIGVPLKGTIPGFEVGSFSSL